MAVEKQRAPSYPWYPRDFDMDEEVKLMTYEEEGVYRRLLDHQWFHGGVPCEIDLLARLVPKLPAAKFKRLWPSMAAKFTAVEGRLVNRKLERVRIEIDGFKERQRQAGRHSAEVRRQRHGSAQPNGASNQFPNEPPNHVPKVVRTSVRTDTSTTPELASASATDDVKNTSSAPPPNDRRTVAERRTSGRIFLHRWQLEALIDALGPHAEGFDLDVWIDGLTAEADAQGVTFPRKEDRWTWIQSALAAEITRRGLPIAGAVPVGLGRPKGCRHEPACTDDVAHTRRASDERRQVPA